MACDHRLSVVIIGRNDADNLRGCLRSLECIPIDRSRFEVVYVDGDSADDSVAVARPEVDLIGHLSGRDVLSAGAGRHHGTQLAHGDWILYLDSDMELCPEFAALLPAITSSDVRAGYVGPMTNIYEDGRIRENAKGYHLERQDAPSFGGAVLLPRAVVLEAGNWATRVVSNEEIDLYVRLRAHQVGIRLVRAPIARHNVGATGDPLARTTVFRSALSGRRRSRGFGQVLRLAVEDGRLPGLVRFFPEPFLAWLGVLALLTAGVVRKRGPAGLALSCFAVVLRRRNPRFLVVAATLAVSALRGWSRLPDEGPSLVEVDVVRPCRTRG